MRRPALLPFAAATCLSLGLAGCSGADGSERIAEPAVSFPVTSTAPAAAPSTVSATPTTAAEDEAGKDADGKPSTSGAEPKTSTAKAKKPEKKEPSTVKRSGGEPAGGTEADADEPSPASTLRVVTECVWPSQADAASGEEYQHFCDGDWALTTLPGEGDYLWKAKGDKWVSIEPAGETDQGTDCYDAADFKGVPEELRKQVTFCAA